MPPHPLNFVSATRLPATRFCATFRPVTRAPALIFHPVRTSHPVPLRATAPSPARLARESPFHNKETLRRVWIGGGSRMPTYGMFTMEQKRQSDAGRPDR